MVILWLEWEGHQLLQRLAAKHTEKKLCWKFWCFNVQVLNACGHEEDGD